MPAPIDETIILEAALAVWREQGFRNATTRKVAERAGVGEVTLFRRFGDKAALFGAALAIEAGRFRAARVAYSGEMHEDLRRIVTAYQALLDRNGGIVLDFLLNASESAELAEIGQIPMMAVAGAALVIAEYQSKGRLQSGPPLELVTDLLGPVVMRYAVCRAHKGFSMHVPAEVVVARFLLGCSERSA